YFGWEGGKVGGGLADVLRFLLGKVAYLVPLVLLGAGSALMLRPALPERVRPRAGATLLLLALTLGFAAGSFGLGPELPARHGYFHASYFNDHGGLVGEALYFAASTLFQRAGAHLAFCFMLLSGALLVTGASITGLVRLAADAARGATARGRGLGRAFADER